MRRIAFLLAAAANLAAYDYSALADTGPCHSMEYERAAYTICKVDLHNHTVRLYWNRSDGTPYAYLSALPRSLEGGTGRMLFATNARPSRRRKPFSSNDPRRTWRRNPGRCW